jgi:membrane-bound metal-dependent hydrolase YbcI (DUF457 family)
MPLPLGHAAAGLAIYELYPTEKPKIKWWRLWLFVAALAVLPDIDFLIGLVYGGNGNIFHRGFTHSLLFALFAGFFASLAGKKWSGIFPPIGFIRSTLIVLSHTILDILFSETGASLFYPFQLVHAAGHSTFWDIARTTIMESYKDAGLIAVSMAIIILARIIKKIHASGKRKGSAPEKARP